MRHFICALIFLSPLIGFAHTLEESFRHALRTNPEMLSSVAKNLSVKQEIEEAIGTFYPAVDVYLGVGRQQTKSPTTSAIDGLAESNLTAVESTMEVTQNIFAGGETIYDIKQARNKYRSQLARSYLFANELAYEVVESYLEILKQERLLGLALKNLNTHKRYVGMIKRRSVAGISRRTDLEQVKGRLAQANVNYINTRNALYNAKVKFQKLTGTNAKHLKWPRIPSKKVLPRNIDSAIETSLVYHPALHSAHNDLLQSKYQHKKTYSTNWPRVDIILTETRNRNTGGLAGFNQSRSAFVKLSYNLFRGGIDFAKQKAAAYNIKEALEQKKEALLLVKQNIKLAWQAWIDASRRLSYYNAHLVSSDKIKRAHMQRFKIGKQKLVSLLDAEYEYYQALVDRESGIYDDALSRYKILETMGVLLPYVYGAAPRHTMLTLETNLKHQWLK